MLKFLGSLIFFFFAIQSWPDKAPYCIALTAAVFYALPYAYARTLSYVNRRRYRRQLEIERLNRENEEERRHREGLRRERERLEMHSDVRVKELISTLEIQFGMDAKKMERLTALKTEFAQRQKSDMAELLGRLEAMKGDDKCAGYP